MLRRDFEQYFLRLMSSMRMTDLFKIDPDMPDSDVDVEYLVDNVFVVGSPDDVAEKLSALYDDVGGFGVLLAMGHEWQPYDRLGTLDGAAGERGRAESAVRRE